MSLYFAAAVPPQELRQKIGIYSRDFARRFNSVKAFKNFPHITLIKPFSFDENKEDELVDKISEMDLKITSFIVDLNNFGCFPNKNNPVIFITPENKEELQKLYDEVQPYLNFHSYAKLNPHLASAVRTAH